MEEGPGARWPRHRLSARTTVTRTMVGPGRQREKRESERGWAARAVVGDWADPFGWPGCLPRVFLFFFETFLFFFSDFYRIRKSKGFGVIIFIQIIFINRTFQKVQNTTFLVLRFSKFSVV